MIGQFGLESTFEDYLDHLGQKRRTGQSTASHQIIEQS